MKYICTDKQIKLIINNKIICYVDIDKNIITNIFVSPEKRYIGYGKNLILYCIEHIKKLGYDKLIVTNYDNAKFNMLIKEGFKLKDQYLVYNGLKSKKLKEEKILKTSIISFLINFFLAFLKVLIGIFFGFASILADGINSSSDCITNLLLIFGCNISNQLEDEKRPFGYGKIESIFSILIGSIMVLSSTFALYNCIKNLFIPSLIINYEKNNILIYILTLSFIFLKILQYFYIKHVALKYDSLLLKTIIKDYSSDILLSISVLIGTVLSIYFTRKIDIILGSILNIYIIYQAVNIIYENSCLLIDTQDNDLLSRVRTILLSNLNIHYVHDLYMLRSGHNIYIYADIRVDKNLTVDKSHQLAENVSLIVRDNIPEIKRVTLHVEPIY